MSKFDIVTASLPDRKEEVAEIFFDDVLWAEISQEVVGQFIVQFYSHPENNFWEFSYEEAIGVLKKAKERLASMKKIDNEDYRKLGIDD